MYQDFLVRMASHERQDLWENLSDSDECDYLRSGMDQNEEEDESEDDED